MSALQTELPLAVAICAWCRPHERGSSAVISHGICPRHLRKLKNEAQGIPARGPGNGRRSAEWRRESPFLPLADLAAS